MDLSSMLNDEGRDRQPPARPSQQHQTAPAPATPSQSAPSRGPYHPSAQGQPSPTMQLSHEFPPHHFAGSPPPPHLAPHGPYPQQHPGPSLGSYVSRPAPPLQPAGPPDPRSPGSAIPAPSPYRQTPSASYPGSGAFPFPAAPQSPSQQRPQYPPATGQLHSRETFSHTLQQQPPTPISHPGHPSHMQSHPQTPVGGLSQIAQQQQHQQASYAHQRSQSSHSTSTPTSAHSQQHYSGPFPQQQPSPVVTNHSLPSDYSRQNSQPPTPGASHLPPGHRQSSSAYGQPTSPYQARSSLASINHHAQGSPPRPPPPTVPRMVSTHNAHESSGTMDSQRRSQSHSERDRSISVSPKTRAPSIPQSQSERAVTPAKRKLSDVEGVEHPRQAQRPAVDLNGAAVPQHLAGTAATAAATTAIIPSLDGGKKMRPHNYSKQPPVWAGPQDGHYSKLQRGNWTLHKRGPKKERVEEDDIFDEGPVPPPPPPAGPPGAPLGTTRYQWDTCLDSSPPAISGLTKAVADFFFSHVVMNQYAGEIRAHKIQFEIEAKLGTVIDKNTDNRVALPVISECALDGPYAFRSSITRQEHEALNSFFNGIVCDTEPRNPRRDPSRLLLTYKHRREVDEFFELSRPDREQLPACIESLIPQRHSVRVRVTKDKTGKLLGAIVKARVGDLHIHFPNWHLDCRLSVNLEMPWHGPIPDEILAPPQGLNDHGRKSMSTGDRSVREKNRLSYRQGVLQVDLTQVTTTLPSIPSQPQNLPLRVQKEYELEIELDGEQLASFGEEAHRGNSTPYTNMVEALLENVRLVARKCHELGPGPGQQ
ncbi:hypothetical protein MKZ38_003904 [Zalerion maritima]|uniref:mRNA-capping enzyme subunit beta n=1 Tax=Zalerion maritima TaxID=339359 RepID=A0AAD5WWJ0_9PEZI|nr:hypothetical protein MKZ38_003904 [Zalerion maritima]